MLEVVVDHALIEASDADSVLFKLADQTLTSLPGYARDIAFCSRILNT